MYAIKQGNYYLAEGSASRGSQGGIARVWSESASGAMLFASGPEAQAFMLAQFQPYERAGMDVVWFFRGEVK